MQRESWLNSYMECRSSLQRGVVNDLVRAAAAVFPRAKGSKLTRAWKARSIDLARIAKKASVLPSDVAGCSSAVALPAEVFEAILSQLQPVSLGNAAAVCRDWRAAVANDALWRRFVPAHIQDDARSYRQQFLARVAGMQLLRGTVPPNPAGSAPRDQKASKA